MNTVGIRTIIVLISIGLSLAILCFALHINANHRPNSGADPRSTTAQDTPVHLHEFTYRQLHMAMPVRLTVWAPDQTTAEEACRAAFARITQLESVLSDYDRHSELSRLTTRATGEPIPVSEDLFSILSYCKRLGIQTDGAFDPTAGPITQLWRKARRHGQLPQPEQLHEALAMTGIQHFELDAEHRQIRLSLDRMQLDLGGVAKGYIGDCVMRVLGQYGIDRACYEAGGDIVLGSPPVDEAGWKIDLPKLGTKVLANCGVSVSGDTVQFLEVNGRRYSHVIDPRSGQAVTSRRMAIVISPSGMQSDSLATVGCVMQPDRFQQVVSLYSNTTAWSYKMDPAHHAVESDLPATGR